MSKKSVRGTIMSGITEKIICPKCGKPDCYNYQDYKRPIDNFKKCLNCGYARYWEEIEKTMDTEELIERRIKQQYEWHDYEYYVAECDEQETEAMSFEEWTKQRVLLDKI